MGLLRKYGIPSVLMVVAVVSACQQKMVCPAYHSYFILDVTETRKQFSLFGPDSLPRQTWDIDKQKVGIAEVVADNRRWSGIDIIPMQSVYIPLEDPFAQYQTEYAEADTAVQVDSLAVLSNYYNDFENVDQMIYLYHFGKYINRRTIDAFDPAEELKDEEPLVEASDLEEEPVKEKKGLWPFGKRKKTKEEQSTDIDTQ
jgi:hypothetical protein